MIAHVTLLAVHVRKFGSADTSNVVGEAPEYLWRGEVVMVHDEFVSGSDIGLSTGGNFSVAVADVDVL